MNAGGGCFDFFGRGHGKKFTPVREFRKMLELHQPAGWAFPHDDGFPLDPFHGHEALGSVWGVEFIHARDNTPDRYCLSAEVAMTDIRNYVRCMGENKRYGFKSVDPALNDVLTRAKPISLTPAEIGATAVPDASEPHEVIAWVRYPEVSVRVHARAVAWTDRAVWVEFTTHSGATHRAWVWASAVSRL